MKTYLFITYLLAFSFSTLAQTENFWVKKSDLGSDTIGSGLKRERAVAFSIGDYGYVGTGIDTAEIVLNDFWKYDPSNNAWTQIATLPGSERRNAVAFEINGLGYVGTGINTVNSFDFGSVILNDFWEYNPTTNSWLPKSAFPGGPVYFATAFTIDSKGYVCGGKMGPNWYSNSLWEYKPSIDVWSQKLNFPGGVRYQMSSFSIGLKAYVGLGTDQDMYRSDIYEYNLITGQWTQKADLPGSSRAGAVAFSLGQRGFICMGTNGGLLEDLWEFNPFSNSWSVKANYGGSRRKNAVGFTINGKAYVGTGKGNSGKKSSFYEYNPSSVLALEELDNTISVFPNPVINNLSIISASENIERIEIYSMLGKNVFSSPFHSKINISELAPATYILMAYGSDNQFLSSLKIIKQ